MKHEIYRCDSCIFRLLCFCRWRWRFVTSIGVADQSIPNATNYPIRDFRHVKSMIRWGLDSANPTRLTVPAGVSKVRVGGQVDLGGQSILGLRQCVIKKNYPSNGGWFPGVPAYKYRGCRAEQLAICRAGRRLLMLPRGTISRSRHTRIQVEI